jgi:hypothetical protein
VLESVRLSRRAHRSGGELAMRQTMGADWRRPTLRRPWSAQSGPGAADLWHFREALARPVGGEKYIGHRLGFRLPHVFVAPRLLQLQLAYVIIERRWPDERGRCSYVDSDRGGGCTGGRTGHSDARARSFTRQLRGANHPQLFAETIEKFGHVGSGRTDDQPDATR